MVAIWDYAVIFRREYISLSPVRGGGGGDWNCPSKASVPEGYSLREGCEFLGRHGWELVSATVHPDDNWGAAAGVVYTMFFKKPA